MKRVQRFDIHRMDQLKRTPEGFLETSVRATRVGIFIYGDANGNPFRELRLPEEVFNQNSMDSIAMKPVTNNHPYELVNIDNVKEHQVGHVGEIVTRNGNFLDIGRVVVTDKKAISDIESGKQEVSCGYNLDLEFESGHWDGSKINKDGIGEPFDAIQRNIVYNHLAIVDKGRAGAQARLRLDSEHNLVKEEEAEMKIKIGEKEFDCSQELADAYGDFLTKVKKDAADSDSAVKEAMKQSKDSREALDKKGSEIEALQGKFDAKDAELNEANDPEKFNARVNERMQLVSTAVQALDAKEDADKKRIDGLTDVEIMKEVITKQNENSNFDGKSEDYIRGQFEIVSGNVKKVNSDGTQMGEKIINGRKERSDEGEASKKADEAKETAAKRDADLWKKPVGPLADKQ